MFDPEFVLGVSWGRLAGGAWLGVLDWHSGHVQLSRLLSR